MAARVPDVEIVWDEPALDEFLSSPSGPLGREWDRFGAIVTAGAKRRALKRTGRMAAEMYYVVGRDERGLYADVVSPARDPRNNFPYPRVHEGRRVRDRRPHRSLRPALNDVRKILAG